MATFAPAFGMLGTLVGLINPMAILGDGSMQTIGQQLAIGLMTTFYDLITLLLAMLVVMLAISRLHGFPGEQTGRAGRLAGRQRPARLRRRIFRVRQGRHSARMRPRPRPAAGHGKRRRDRRRGRPPLKAPSKESLGLADLGKSVDVIVNEQSVSFRISNELLFASGQATLSPPGWT